MKLSIYDKATGRIAKIVVVGSRDAALAMARDNQAVSEDSPAERENDKTLIVDPTTGLHRLKTQDEISDDRASVRQAKDRMWAKELADREQKKQDMINKGVSAEIADAVIMAMFDERG